jgi:antitoxin (DNA-binding transcriptional repressor) of toxin-antitoxin stability system
MRVVGLKILKNKLSEYVRLAAAGKTILVTDRDHVIAELGPARQERSQMTADAVLSEAVRKGWITPPLTRVDGPPPRLPVMPIEELLKELEADREAR